MSYTTWSHLVLSARSGQVKISAHVNLPPDLQSYQAHCTSLPHAEPQQLVCKAGPQGGTAAGIHAVVTPAPTLNLHWPPRLGLTNRTWGE